MKLELSSCNCARAQKHKQMETPQDTMGAILVDR